MPPLKEIQKSLFYENEYIFSWIASSVTVFLTLLFVLQPCQTLYQVFHDAVTRLIQYGVLYVAEVSLPKSNLTYSGQILNQIQEANTQHLWKYQKYLKY